MINLYNIDCMKLMADKPDNYYSVAITDPPYGIGFDGHDQINGKTGRKKGFKNGKLYALKKWDANRPPIEYFKELQRVSTNQIIWGGNYFSDILPVSRGWIFWDKKIVNANNKTFSDGELAWSSFDCVLRRFTYDWIGFGYLNNTAKEKKQHPCQKPIKLYEWLLENYAKSGDTILDTHGGSMSSVIACINMEFSIDCTELDTDYFDNAVNRVQAHASQLDLFRKQPIIKIHRS